MVCVISSLAVGFLAYLMVRHLETSPDKCCIELRGVIRSQMKGHETFELSGLNILIPDQDVSQVLREHFSVSDLK